MAGTCGKVYRAFSGYTDEGTGFTYQEIGRNEDLGNPFVKKCGGELIVKAAISGNSDIDVYISLDNSGYHYMGKLNVAGSLVTFPVTFPVNFPTQNEAMEKFHLDSLGDWYRVKIKLEQVGANSTEIKILERSIVTFLNQYRNEG